MNKTKQAIYWIIILVILLPILTFPLAPDPSIYLESGKIIAQGGKLYVNTIDLKQPLIYYIFTGIYLIFGNSAFGIRFFDLIWQGLTVLSLYILIKKALTKKAALTAAIIYSLSYTALNYTQTLQCETMAGLPLTWIIYFLIFKKDEFIYDFAIGILTGFIAGLKYTMGIILIPLLAYEGFASKRIKNSLKNTLLIAAGFIIGFFITMSPLLDSQVFNGYRHVFQYLSFYSSVNNFNIAFISSSIKKIGYFFGDRYSLALTIVTSGGVFTYIKIQKTSKNNQCISLLNISITLALFLFFSVAVEAKFWFYHFARMYIPLSILATAGLYEIYKKLRDYGKGSGNYIKALIIIILLSAIIFSPISRWLAILKESGYFFKSRTGMATLYESTENDNFTFSDMEYRKIADIINKNNSSNEPVIVITTGSNTINYYLNTDKVTRFRNSQFIFNTLNIKEWQVAFQNRIYNAEWVVVSTDDGMIDVIHNSLSSWEHFQNDKEIFPYFNLHFSKFSSVGNFLIFKRILTIKDKKDN